MPASTFRPNHFIPSRPLPLPRVPPCPEQSQSLAGSPVAFSPLSFPLLATWRTQRQSLSQVLTHHLRKHPRSISRGPFLNSPPSFLSHFPSGQGVYFYFISWNLSFEIINHFLAAIFLHPGKQKTHNTLEFFNTHFKLCSCCIVINM